MLHTGWARWRLFVLYVLPCLSIFGVVVGALVAGWATPTECAAVGAFATLVFAAAYRALTASALMRALRGTAAISAMILFIILGATTFAQILSFSGASNGLVQTITGQAFSTGAIVAAMMAMLIFLGIFVDQVSMMMITLPIFMPVVQTLGIDPVWFGVMYLICMQLGLLLPPHGLLLMTMRGVAPPEVRMGHIFAAVVPYVSMSLLLLAAVFAWPAIATWLPQADRLIRRADAHHQGIHSSSCSLASVRCAGLIGRMPATICLMRSRSISRARVARCSCASGLRSRLTSQAADDRAEPWPRSCRGRPAPRARRRTRRRPRARARGTAAGCAPCRACAPSPPHRAARAACAWRCGRRR